MYCALVYFNLNELFKGRFSLLLSVSGSSTTRFWASEDEMKILERSLKVIRVLKLYLNF